MKRIFTLLAIAGITFTSCNKDETIQAKDYENYSEDANLNSENGKIIVDPHTGVEGPQYYYSVQYSFDFSSKELSAGIVNSSDSYDNIVLPKDPANGNELTEKLPASGEWNLLITQYLTEDIYEEEGVTKYQAYPVVGVLSNKGKGVEVANVKDANFENITLADANKMDFSDDFDAIGFDWKELNFSTFTYEIVADNYYLVKLMNGDIYKLKFEDFYGTKVSDESKQEKGHVKFQYQLLK